LGDGHTATGANVQPTRIIMAAAGPTCVVSGTVLATAEISGVECVSGGTVDTIRAFVGTQEYEPARASLSGVTPGNALPADTEGTGTAALEPLFRPVNDVVYGTDGTDVLTVGTATPVDGRSPQQTGYIGCFPSGGDDVTDDAGSNDGGIHGGTGNDSLPGDAGDDVLTGGDGNANLPAGGGAGCAGRRGRPRGRHAGWRREA
jgi:Ca2+-binding RTX toxin-like protein